MQTSTKCAFTLPLMVLGMMSLGHAELGLIGGQAGDSSAYAAQVVNGTLMPISGLPSATAEILSVALNPLGQGIIGGTEPSGGYAAFVDANGNLTSLTLPIGVQDILSVSINGTGQALIGGLSAPAQAYAASVSPGGTVTPLSLSVSSGHISTTALNDLGEGLIGGQGNGIKAYAAYISPSGMETVLVGPGAPVGSSIQSVAINKQGNGIIGGNIFNSAFGALTSQGTVTADLAPLPPSFSTVASVAINDAGLGLIGGTDNLGNAFAGYVASDGTVTSLSLGMFTGSIQTVALNASGQGLIGGDNNSNTYAALINPQGGVTALISSPPSGSVNSVAINDAGIGLFGGQINGNQGYAALVAPNGALTFLDVSAEIAIDSVALENMLSSELVATLITPKSIGFLNGVFYTQLAASSALESRFIEQNKVWKRQPLQPSVAQRDVLVDDELLAANTAELTTFVNNEDMTRSVSSELQTKNSIWVAPFGDVFQLKGQGSLPRVRNDIGGILLGYDRQGNHFLAGGALGYAFNYLHYGSQLGHGQIQEEMASVYSSFYAEHFWLGVAIWGGYYHFTNVRHASSLITSRGKTHGWIFAPHLEMATPWAMDRHQLCFVEPFISVDWVKDWQHAFTESGASGFNLKMKSVHGSLLQSEAGLRFYERFVQGWGDFLLEEKLSYVNQVPFFDKKVTTTFVSSTVGFPIAIGSTQVENLGCVGLMAAFVPAKKSYPFGGVDAQVTVNGAYQSYFVSLFTGWDY